MDVIGGLLWETYRVDTRILGLDHDTIVTWFGLLHGLDRDRPFRHGISEFVKV